MRIFVAGPYGDSNPKDVIKANVMAADEIGRTLLKMGHIPFIPHKMTWGWEDDQEIAGGSYLSMNLEWLSLCDAIFMLPTWMDSVGATNERSFARSNGILVCYSFEDIQNSEV